MALNDAAINYVFDRLVSFAMASARFDAVNSHEPKNAPGLGLSCAIWMQTIQLIGSSGLSAASGLLIIHERVYTNFAQQPFDMIDPNVTAAMSDLLSALCGDFQLGGGANVRHVDLLGAHGQPLTATAGYVEIDRIMFRVMTATIPIVINDMFTEAP